MSCYLRFCTTLESECMKIDRLIGIITILLGQDKVTAPELAKRFEVSRRTINRDIEDICKAGIPLITTQGYGGGISIADGYKIEKTLFTEEELQTIFTALKGVDSVSKTPYLEKLLEKLSSKNKQIIANDNIVIDLASFSQTPLTEKIEILKNAIGNKHYVSFQYYYEKGECKRRIEPYRLVFKWSTWYVFGYCLDKKDYRMFKLNRLWNLQLIENTFSPRDVPLNKVNFDNHFISNAAFHLKAIFSASEKYRIIEEYGIDSYTLYSNEKLLFQHDFASYENMRNWVFSFGDKVEILEPKELYCDRLQQAKNIISQEMGKEK